MQSFNLYEDIAERTNGDIYIGVVGPVRTGKSTFIRKFMEEIVLPGMEPGGAKTRAIDELPQAGDGKTIMTAEPKFVPNTAVSVSLGNAIRANVRLIDCVGYMVEGATGNSENGKERMVMTPWHREEIPMSRAAELGTQKVIGEHSTIGIVVTTDGSITGIPRESYAPVEERVVSELKAIGKPFALVLNCADPTAAQCVELKAELEKKYGVGVIATDVSKMNREIAEEILSEVLLEFPIRSIECKLPKWMQALSGTDKVISDFTAALGESCKAVIKMRDALSLPPALSATELGEPQEMVLETGSGTVTLVMKEQPELFYRTISEQSGKPLGGDFELLKYVRDLSLAERNYAEIKDALETAEQTGYGIVQPTLDKMTLEEPVIVNSGGKFGVKLKASAPSLHIIKVDVETEVNPVVGSEKQGEEMVNYLMSDFDADKERIWDTNMLGKPLSSVVKEGLSSKLNGIPPTIQTKLRKAMGRIVNEGKGTVLCILL